MKAKYIEVRNKGCENALGSFREAVISTTYRSFQQAWEEDDSQGKRGIEAGSNGPSQSSQEKYDFTDPTPPHPSFLPLSSRGGLTLYSTARMGCLEMLLLL
jgi:hypothetical protein